jgi:hypothetical protein
MKRDEDIPSPPIRRRIDHRARDCDCRLLPAADPGAEVAHGPDEDRRFQGRIFHVWFFLLR